GARLMPAVLAVVFAGLRAGHFAPALAAAERPAWPDVPSRRRVGFVFGVLVLYVAVLPSLGFLPATALFVLVLLRALAAFSWTVALALTAAIALASHVVFKHWPGMPPPSGPLGL
ncbi:MAG: tripartite tricarboxylate transporter TctB family protein, partial [Candidatus Rokubacteria bacterium]|nr:tripartite tricarboxylate transporter TctB family protein [Candidatus Rokubacteria bacterium]